MHRRPIPTIIPTFLLCPVVISALGLVTGSAAASSLPTDSASDTELEAPLSRLVAGNGDAAELLLIDLDDTGARYTVELPAPAGLSSAVTSDGRFVLAGHDDAVSIVDGGTWAAAHGDHAHYYASEPALLGTVEGDHPSHLISHDGLTALWFDGAGEAVVFEEADFADGVVDAREVLETAGPHHGFAVPFADRFVVTAPGDEGDMPDVVTVTAPSGSVLSEHSCVESHGETAWAHGVAVACRDGVLLLTETDGAWAGELIPYPETDDTDPYGFGPARSWVLDAPGDGEKIVAPFGTSNVLALDGHDASASLVDLGADVAMFGSAAHEPSSLLAVLTTDGAVSLVDVAGGSVVATATGVVPAFTEGDPEQPYPSLTIAGDTAFVSDPAGTTVSRLAIDTEGATPTLTAADSIDVGFTPTFLAVVNP